MVTDDWHRWAELPLGCENLRPHVGSLVVSELNYNPGEPSAAALSIDPAFVEDDLEFVEILNPTFDEFDASGWRLRGGVDYDVPDGTTLPAGGTLVILSFNPGNPDNAIRTAAFRAHYGIDESIVLLGGFGGQLSDSGESVRLNRPGTSPAADPNLIPRITVDEVLYDDLPVWPSADGTGAALQRRSAVYFGNEASSWSSGVPTPGTASFANGVLGDFTGDGLVDAQDIDVLYDRLRRGTPASQFDLSGNLSVGSEDAEYLVTNVLGTQFGDANLDGFVDGSDFNRWNAHKFSACGGSWGDGEFTGDGVVDASDFHEWFAHRFTGSGNGGAVAESVPRAAVAGGVVAADEVLARMDALGATRGPSGVTQAHGTQSTVEELEVADELTRRPRRRTVTAWRDARASRRDQVDRALDGSPFEFGGESEAFGGESVDKVFAKWWR